MELAQLFKTNHEKAIELFDKLAETSDGAVKTRDRLFAQLKAVIESHARAVHDHLYSALLRNAETRDLVPSAQERSQIDERLAALDAMPKSDEAFLERLGELRKSVEQHYREEERRIVPALKKTLGEDEARDLARTLEEAARQALEDVAQGRSETIRKTQTAVEAMVENTTDHAGTVAGEFSEMAYAGLKIAAEGPRQLFEVASGQTEQAQRNATGAAEIYSDTSQSVLGDIETLMSVSSIVSQGLQEAQRTWLNSVVDTVQAGARASQELWRCTNPQEFAEVQRQALKESMNGWLQGSAELLRISGRVAEAALRPVEARVRAAKADEGRGGSRPRLGRAA